VVVHKHHEEIGARRGEPPVELVEAAVEPVPLRGRRDVRPSGDHGRVGCERGGDDLGHGTSRSGAAAHFITGAGR
jgi:hypothetical protein